jgi:hypothetical protein
MDLLDRDRDATPRTAGGTLLKSEMSSITSSNALTLENGWSRGT